MSGNNINTKAYWDKRFSSGDWELKLGRQQTREFALAQIKHIDISRSFSGSILDFGCGLGDAFPIYKKSFPNAELLGLDISIEAIRKCIKSYGEMGNFICGSYLDVPEVDIIIASNVFEHLSNDKEIAKHLISKCQRLYIIVPYREEKLSIFDNEHINIYNEQYFTDLSKDVRYKIFNTKAWGKDGFDLYYNIYLKNFARLFLGKKLQKRPRQIMFKIIQRIIQ